MYQSGDKIDAEKLIQAVRELAAEQPDFVYTSEPHTLGPTCYYTTETGAGDCIIGQAMARIGQALPAQLRDGTNECQLLNSSVGSGSWIGALGTTSKNCRWLRDVQLYQDRRETWSEAVRRADNNI